MKTLHFVPKKEIGDLHFGEKREDIIEKIGLPQRTQKIYGTTLDFYPPFELSYYENGELGCVTVILEDITEEIYVEKDGKRVQLFNEEGELLNSIYELDGNYVFDDQSDDLLFLDSGIIINFPENNYDDSIIMHLIFFDGKFFEYDENWENW